MNKSKVDYVALGMGLTLNVGMAVLFAVIAKTDHSVVGHAFLTAFAVIPLIIAGMLICMDAKDIMEDVKSRLMGATTRNMEAFQNLVSGLLESNPGSSVEFLGDWCLLVKDDKVIASWKMTIILGVGFGVGKVHSK